MPAAGQHNVPADGAAGPSGSSGSLGSSVLTTPKFHGQTEPAENVDYSPTYATGNELKDRKNGIFKRPRAGDDDDAF